MIKYQYELPAKCMAKKVSGLNPGYRGILLLIAFLAIIHIPPTKAQWECSFCKTLNLESDTSCKNCSKLKPGSKADIITKRLQGVGDQIEKKLSTQGKKINPLFPEQGELQLAMGLLMHQAGDFSELVSDLNWLEGGGAAMSDVTGGVSCFVASAPEASASPSGATDHSASIKEAHQQFEQVLKTNGKTLCRHGVLCGHEGSEQENVLHLQDSIVARAIMLGLAWRELYQSEVSVVSATQQALEHLTDNIVTHPESSDLQTFLQTYHCDDMTEGYDASGIISYALDVMRQRSARYIMLQLRPEVFITIIRDTETGTFTWIVGPFIETAVTKSRLKVIIEHILNYKHGQSSQCSMM